jgi:hypothetical protein
MQAATFYAYSYITPVYGILKKERVLPCVTKYVGGGIIYFLVNMKKFLFLIGENNNTFFPDMRMNNYFPILYCICSVCLYILYVCVPYMFYGVYYMYFCIPTSRFVKFHLKPNFSQRILLAKICTVLSFLLFKIRFPFLHYIYGMYFTVCCFTVY